MKKVLFIIFVCLLTINFTFITGLYRGYNYKEIDRIYLRETNDEDDDGEEEEEDDEDDGEIAGSSMDASQMIDRNDGANNITEDSEVLGDANSDYVENNSGDDIDDSPYDDEESWPSNDDDDDDDNDNTTTGGGGTISSNVPTTNTNPDTSNTKKENILTNPTTGILSMLFVLGLLAVMSVLIVYYQEKIKKNNIV